MSAKTKTSFRTELRKAFWPIEWHENKKFIPMALMMAFILFNYAMLRTIKDGLVVTNVGAEALGFLKTYFVLPSAVLMVVVYTKLCNVMSQQRVFYTITLFFLTYLAIFTFVLYPNPDFFLPSADKVDLLSQKLPNLKWFIKIGGFWTYATFYVVAELWGSMMMSLLFWQFANQITKTSEAKRFYSMFGMLGNFGLPLVALVSWLFLKKYTNVVPSHVSLMPILTVTLLAGVVVLALYRWINKNVLTDPTLYDPSAIGAPKKKKAKLSVMESFKIIFTSKYLGLIALLIIGYSISINLVEGVWKAKVRELYPTIEGYTFFMSTFQLYQGIAAIICMLIGANILRRVTWNTAALFTPLMILFTGLAFFAFILFDKTIGLYLAMLFGSGPLMMAVMVGTAQNVLSKAVKYSLFDSTKEMAYIPLDDELKSKGKAAVDVIGGRFGKSGGGLIQSTFFLIFPAFSFVEATPYFGAIFFVIVIAWIYAVRALGHEYRIKLLESGEAKKDKEVLKEAKMK